MLRTRQRTGHRFIEHLAVRRAVPDQVFDQFAVAAEDQRLGNRVVVSAEIRSEHIICSEPYGVTDPVAVDEFMNVFRLRPAAIVDVQSDDLNAAVMTLSGNSSELRSLLTAR